MATPIGPEGRSQMRLVNGVRFHLVMTFFTRCGASCSSSLNHCSESARSAPSWLLNGTVTGAYRPHHGMGITNVSRGYS